MTAMTYPQISCVEHHRSSKFAALTLTSIEM